MQVKGLALFSWSENPNTHPRLGLSVLNFASAAAMLG
ncbi:hypothetical protein SAMN05216506_11823 [Saccharopolyspora kobensis]|uniref:Uncharacterized protein n=1 Tax=Saccharopolyspora kobensis TaxID=146035 RepID=A0ABY1E6N8_9PSEU|nr:hypothetical protein SAMN05216506_11823 [Saccharopolyspora kobensis]